VQFATLAFALFGGLAIAVVIFLSFLPH